MQIRPDLSSVEIYLHRLSIYGDTFSKNNLDEWPHLKNNEDFRKVYVMDNEYRRIFEKVYSDGRDLAVHMSIQLKEFNNIADYPTLKSYVASFYRKNGWLANISELKEFSKLSAQKRDELDDCPWAVEQMIYLFDKQIELLESVAETLNILKTTEIYKIENGEPVMKNEGAKIYHISNINNSAINIESPSASASVESSADIKNTLSQLTEIFQTAQFSDTGYREQSLEILSSIRDEIQKPQPKKLSIGAMISTLSGLASLATSIHTNAPLLLDKLKQFIQQQVCH